MVTERVSIDEKERQRRDAPAVGDTGRELADVTGLVATSKTEVVAAIHSTKRSAFHALVPLKREEKMSGQGGESVKRTRIRKPRCAGGGASRAS